MTKRMNRLEARRFENQMRRIHYFPPHKANGDTTMNAKTTKGAAALLSTASPVTFDFDTFETSIAIPEKLPAAPRANQLPFADLFDKMKGPALEGKQPHKFIPTAFWIARAGDIKGGNPEKAKEPGYAKQKVRDQFNKWTKAGKIEGITLTAIERKGTEEEVFKALGIEPTPGLSIWLQKAA